MLNDEIDKKKQKTIQLKEKKKEKKNLK